MSSLCRCSHSVTMFTRYAARVDRRLLVVPRRQLASSSQHPKQQQTAALSTVKTQNQGRDDASLSRYPNLRSPGGILRGLDYAGTLTFALTGAVTAAQSGLDVFGSTMAAVITAVGGGTIRDAIFLNRRPFWTEESEYIWMGACMGLITFFVWPGVLEWQEEHKAKKKMKLIEQGDEIDGQNEVYDEMDGALDTLDAIGLSSFAIIGAQNGVRAGMPMIVSAICGMATSTFGGLTRDVLCGRPIRIVHSNAEIYAEPALAGATTYLVAERMGAKPGLRIGLAMAVCIGSRFIAIKNDVKNVAETWNQKGQMNTNLLSRGALKFN
eukprot:scaffold1837_cov124-Skeletonema_menzelii.AAC.3